MKKSTVSIMMLIGLTINLAAVTTLRVHDTAPKYRITYEVINPKFVPDNFSCNTYEELQNHHFQIPDTLLKELTNEELVKYILSTTEYSLSPDFSVWNNDFSGFNGYNELIRRSVWADDIINLSGKYLDERNGVMFFQSVRFSTMHDVYTKMTFQQQQQILMNLKGFLSFQESSPEYVFVSLIGDDLCYWAGAIIESYYASDIGSLITIMRPYFENWVKDPVSLVRSELQKAIDSGMHIEVGYENKN
ncbi:MAG: hypothetical protein CVU50_01485 [Candidatus Cloacimonetes bacterium HGW-Cloacimonetes-3]|nr:MAG: hypothetical protein CVU50_01485 [Candidatus Cloacimonetes bacterium HGW-Cloacimonetes-3]